MVETYNVKEWIEERAKLEGKITQLTEELETVTRSRDGWKADERRQALNAKGYQAKLITAEAQVVVLEDAIKWLFDTVDLPGGCDLAKILKIYADQGVDAAIDAIDDAREK
jgi:hypothetical protein